MYYAVFAPVPFGEKIEAMPLMATTDLSVAKECAIATRDKFRNKGWDGLAGKVAIRRATTKVQVVCLAYRMAEYGHCLNGDPNGNPAIGEGLLAKAKELHQEATKI